MIHVVGNAAIDTIFRVDRFPLPGETIVAGALAEDLGGKGAKVIATVSRDYRELPLLVGGTHGKGRTLAWTSDVGPHWLPQSFVDWPGYAVLWRNMLRWLAKRV